MGHTANGRLSFAMTILMSLTWSLTKLCLVGVTVGHPGLHMTMHAIVYEAVTALCAVERAVEKLCCISLYRGNTPHAPCREGS